MKTKNWINETIGGCKLLRFIAKGGMGTVYEAKKLSINKQVAIKILNPSLENEIKSIKRFVREAHITAQLNHPNILRINNFGQDQGVYFIEMEFIDGESLKERIAREGPISLPKSLKIVEEISRGLAFAHKANILHRDIKPENIMISNNGEIKIADFGLSKFSNQNSELSKSGEFLGTPYYMAPELIESPNAADCRIDIYSLGITLYYMLSGRVPFEGQTPIEVAYKHVNEPLPPIRNIIHNIPDKVEELLVRLTEKKLEKRIKNADEIISEIKEIRTILLEDTYVAAMSFSQKMAESSYKVNLEENKPKSSNLIKIIFVLLIILGGMLGLISYKLFFSKPSKEEKKNIKKEPVNTAYEQYKKQENICNKLWEKAERNLVLGQYNESLKNLDEIIIRYPKSSYFQKAKSKKRLILEEMDKTKVVEMLWEKSEEQIKEKKYENALDILLKIISDYPESEYTKKAQKKRKLILKRISNSQLADILWKRAIKSIEEKQYEEALEILNEIIANYPNSNYITEANKKRNLIINVVSKDKMAELLWNRALKTLANDKFKESLKILEKLISNYPDSSYIKQAKSKIDFINNKMLAEESNVLWSKIKEEMSEKKYEESARLLDEFIKRYPYSKYNKAAQRQRKFIQDIIDKNKQEKEYLSSNISRIKTLVFQKNYSKALVLSKSLWESNKDRNVLYLLRAVRDKIYPKTKNIELEKGVKLTLSLIKNGIFEIGTSDSNINFRPDERLHTVRIKKPFYIGKYEITVAQYKLYKFCNGNNNLPAVEISWIDARNYCEWLTGKTGLLFRLPTEAEWEYCCRADTKTDFSWGNKADKSKANYTYEEDWISNWRKHSTKPVGSYSANPWGLYDMHGNVWEWTGSDYDFYYKGKETELADKNSKSSKVIRGGGWNFRASGMRGAYRDKSMPYKKNPWTGFRVICEIPQKDLWIFEETN